MSDWIAPDEFIENKDWVIVQFGIFGRQHTTRRGETKTPCGCQVEPNGTVFEFFSEAHLCARCHRKYIDAVPRTAAQIAEHDRLMAEHLEMVRALKGRKRK